MILSSDQKYKPKIYGYGEIYEEVSTNRQLRKITKKYNKSMKVVIMSRCGDKKLLESEKKIKPYKNFLIEFVPCDNPIWNCSYSDGSEPIDKHRPLLLLWLSRYIFYFLCPVFEYRRDPNKAHVKIGVLNIE